MVCDIVKDLIPLYADGVCSDASGEEVREHLKKCANCRAVYESAHKTIQCDVDRMELCDVRPFRNIKRKLGALTAAVVILTGYLFCWIFLISPSPQIREFEGRYRELHVVTDSGQLMDSQRSILNCLAGAYPERDFYVIHLNNVYGNETGGIVSDAGSQNLVFGENHFGLCRIYDCQYDVVSKNLAVRIDYRWRWGTEEYCSFGEYEELLKKGGDTFSGAMSERWKLEVYPESEGRNALLLYSRDGE